MPSYLVGNRSSRIQKPDIRRSSSSPFSAARRTKSTQRSRSLATALHDSDEDEEDELLAGSGKVVSVLSKESAKDVPSAMHHATTAMFEEIPDRAGMNSVRIAEVLNFQKGLPRVVSLAHVHALISASSRTEREVQSLLSDNRLRKLKIVGRGTDVSGMSEVLISTSDYEQMVKRSGLPDETVAAFSDALKICPRVATLPASALPRVHSTALAKSGFLVSSSLTGSRVTSGSADASIVARSTVSRAASGSQAAVGGEAAFEILGGVGGARRISTDTLSTGELALSVPNIGPYLRLLTAGRNHLLNLLRKSSKHRQAPLYLLREKWDGNIDSDTRVSTAKRIRGEFSNVFAAKTKKWKDLNGLSFDWVLEECLGAGLIELFETHSVGYGVRSLV